MTIPDVSRTRWRKSSYSGTNGNCFAVAAWRKSSYSSDNGNCVEVAAWRKASYSGQNGNCVEVAGWRKSSFSSQNGACVEAAADGTLVAIRDNKDPNGPHLEFGPEAWRAFAVRLKATAAQA
jgi:hypothetical protein